MRNLVAACLSIAVLSPCAVPAQQSAPPAAPPPASSASASAASPSASHPTNAADPATRTPPRKEADTLEPAVDTSAQSRAGANSGKAMDQLQLGTTDITGNRELPKVMYIVPWKHSDLGDLTGKPLNSLVDQVLQPVDRDVFKRENRYYGAVAQKGAAGGAAPAPAVNADRSGSRGESSAAGDER